MQDDDKQSGNATGNNGKPAVAADGQQHLPGAYERIMGRARELLGAAERPHVPALGDLVERAAQTAVELGELTRDEAKRIGIWLENDLRDAAQHLRETGQELREWLRFDVDLLEDRLRENLQVMVDHTREELERLDAEAHAARDAGTGEVVGPGTLFCQSCGQSVTLKESGHVPPCPKCHGTRFSRAVVHRED